MFLHLVNYYNLSIFDQPKFPKERLYPFDPIVGTWLKPTVPPSFQSQTIFSESFVLPAQKVINGSTGSPDKVARTANLNYLIPHLMSIERLLELH